MTVRTTFVLTERRVRTGQETTPVNVPQPGKVRLIVIKNWKLYII